MTPRKRLFVLVPICVAAMVALWPAEISAQHRVYRRAPAHSNVFVGVGYGYPAFGYPYYYRSVLAGLWLWLRHRVWLRLWLPVPVQYPYPYPPYGYGYYDPGADLRTQVTPREAEVYVDGYLTGNVDDFDGIFQRLRVPLGEHEITIYKEGFRTIRQKMLFRPFESYSLRETMQPLAPGDAGRGPSHAGASARRRRGRPLAAADLRPAIATPTAIRIGTRIGLGRSRYGSSRLTRRCSSTANAGRRPRARTACSSS